MPEQSNPAQFGRQTAYGCTTAVTCAIISVDNPTGGGRDSAGDCLLNGEGAILESRGFGKISG